MIAFFSDMDASTVFRQIIFAWDTEIIESIESIDSIESVIESGAHWNSLITIIPLTRTNPTAISVLIITIKVIIGNLSLQYSKHKTNTLN